MNYAELDTASDILEAFDNCNNAGEEIELFEYLATRPNPPVGAFVSILNEVQLEPVLVLTIKAFGMITDRDLKELWQQNDVVLKLLSEKAKFGASDLIRWTAAVAIDAIGFGIVEISRHLPEKPVKIAERIVESKRKILIDSDDKSKGEQKIVDRNDYRSFIDFWVYGATYDLRAITAKYRDKNSSIVVAEVVKAQGIHGIKETNKLLQKAEDRDYPDELTKQVYENELFERFTYHLSTQFLRQENPRGFEHLVENQGHSLQSEDAKIRMKAASIILGINKNVLNNSIPQGTQLLQIANAMTDCDFNLGTDFYYRGLVYEKLAEIVANLRIAKDLVSRDGVVKHFTDYLNKLSRDLSRLSPGLSWEQIQALAEKERREEAARQKVEREAQAERDRVTREEQAEREHVAREAREERERADAARRQADIEQEMFARAEKKLIEETQKQIDRIEREKYYKNIYKENAQKQSAKNLLENQQRAAQLAEKERLSKIEEQKRVARLAEERRLAKSKADAKLVENILLISVILIVLGLIVGYPATVCINAYLHDAERMRGMPPLTLIGVGAIFAPLVWLFVGFQFLMALLVGIFTGFHYPDDTLASLGGGFLLLLGSSAWIIIPFLISLLASLVKEE